MSNSDSEALNRVRELAGCAEEDLIFREANICDENALEEVLTEFKGRIGSW